MWSVCPTCKGTKTVVERCPYCDGGLRYHNCIKCRFGELLVTCPDCKGFGVNLDLPANNEYPKKWPFEP